MAYHRIDNGYDEEPTMVPMEPVTCEGSCGETYDAEDKMYEVTTTVARGKKLKYPMSQTVCSDCVEVCNSCGGKIEDESYDELGPMVFIRGHIGLRSELLTTHHAVCGADTLLGVWSGQLYLFSTESECRGVIEQAATVTFYEETK
jgi:hypothetical protein